MASTSRRPPPSSAASTERFRRLGPETNYGDLPSSVAFVHGAAIIAAPSGNGRLRLIPVDGGKERSAAIARLAVGCVAISPNGEQIVTSSACIAARTAKPIWRSKWAFLAAVFTPDGKKLIASYATGVGRIDQKTGALRGGLDAIGHTHTGTIVALALSRDGRLLASGCNSGMLTITELATGKVIATDRNRDDPGRCPINALAFGCDVLVVGREGGDIRIVSPRRLVLRRTLALPESAPGGEHASEARGLAITADGTTLFATTHATFPNGKFTRKEAHVMAWRIDTGRELARWPFPHGIVTHGGLAISDDDKTLALSAVSGVYVCSADRV